MEISRVNKIPYVQFVESAGGVSEWVKAKEVLEEQF